MPMIEVVNPGNSLPRQQTAVDTAPERRQSTIRILRALSQGLNRFFLALDSTVLKDSKPLYLVQPK